MDLMETIASAIDKSPHNDLKEWARAALAAIEAAGFAVVPRNATDAMERAVYDPRVANGSPWSKGFHDTWAAALAAAPIGQKGWPIAPWVGPRPGHEAIGHIGENTGDGSPTKET